MQIGPKILPKQRKITYKICKEYSNSLFTQLSSISTPTLTESQDSLQAHKSRATKS